MKLYLHLLLATTLIGIVSLQAADTDWMSGIDARTRLSQISIPGTHDSVARKESWPGTAKCQNLGIAEQLGIGIRYFDARCRHVRDGFPMYHGQVDQGLSFGEMLESIYAFLAANPSECVMMAVKEEHTPEDNHRSFEATFDSFVAAHPDRWWLRTKVPTLGEARGKIVLVRRFSATTAKGIDATKWPDNSAFTINNLAVEDHYRVEKNDIKWTQITTALDAAAADTNIAVLHIIHASGYRSGTFGIPSIPNVSDFIIPRLQTRFATAKRGHYGCVLMDFADAGRSQSIYQTNFDAPSEIEHRPGDINQGRRSAPIA